MRPNSAMACDSRVGAVLRILSPISFIPHNAAWQRRNLNKRIIYNIYIVIPRCTMLRRIAQGPKLNMHQNRHQLICRLITQRS
jgi:hypothetical protein